MSHSFSRCIGGWFIQLAKATNTNRKETQPLWSAIPLLFPVPYFPSVVPSHGWGGETARSVQGIIRTLLEAERNPFQHWIIDAPACSVTCLHGVYRFQDTLFQNLAADGLLDHHIQGSKGYGSCYLLYNGDYRLSVSPHLKCMKHHWLQKPFWEQWCHFREHL